MDKPTISATDSYRINDAAKMLVFGKLEEAWTRLDEAVKRIETLSEAIGASLPATNDDDDYPPDVVAGIAAARVLAVRIKEIARYMWAEVDGSHTALRDELGIKRAAYQEALAQMEASHG